MRARTVVGLGAAAWLLQTGVLTPRRFRVHDVPLAVPGGPAALDGLRVAIIGDLHVGAPWVDLPRLESIVQQVVDAQPDLILLLGDHLADVHFGRSVEPGALAAALAGLLRADVPVLGVLGNHDWYAGGHRVRACLEAAGLPVLAEAAVPVLEDRLWVAGVSDLWERAPVVADALAHVPADAPVLLMTHNPDVVAAVPPSVQLVVAGHTHGGQFVVRGRPTHKVSERSGNRWLSGWYADDRLFVTSGVGSSLIPLRSITPEVPILEIRAR